jgi:uncharacterized protein (TIRG00374 family)
LTHGIFGAAARFVMTRGRLLIGIALTVVFIVLLLRTVDLADVGHTIADADPWYLLPIAAVYALRFWLRAFRWRHLVRHLKPIPTREALPRVILSQSVNAILPFQLGYIVMVQISAAYWGFKRSTLFGAEAVERMMDGLAFAVFLILGAVFLDVGAWFVALAAFMGFGVMSGFLLAWYLSGREDDPDQPQAAAGIRRMWQRSYRAVIGPFLTGMRSLHDRRQTIDLVMISMGVWFSEAVLYWLVGEALDIDASFLTYVFIVGAANVGAAIPSTQASIGPFEYFTQQALVANGVDLDTATAYAFSLHGLLIAPTLIAGPIAAWYMRLSWRDLFPGLKDKDKQVQGAAQPTT